jgi:hypothetical protein
MSDSYETGQEGIVLEREADGTPIYRGPSGEARLTSIATEISDALIHDYVEINEIMRDEGES